MNNQKLILQQVGLNPLTKMPVFNPVRFEVVDRSKYMPHQSKKECARRIGQR